MREKPGSPRSIVCISPVVSSVGWGSYPNRGDDCGAPLDGAMK